MSYSYAKQREHTFTESGQRMFLSIRDRTNALLAKAGAARCEEMMCGETGSSWDMLACVDRMVELGEIREVTTAGAVAGQHRVFVATR